MNPSMVAAAIPGKTSGAYDCSPSNQEPCSQAKYEGTSVKPAALVSIRVCIPTAFVVDKLAGLPASSSTFHSSHGVLPGIVMPLARCGGEMALPLGATNRSLRSAD